MGWWLSKWTAQFWAYSSQHVLLKPAAAGPAGNSLEMQTLGPIPDP